MLKDDPFWKDDITILFDVQRLIEFVPTSDMTVNEKLNAVTRFLTYAGILLSIIYSTPNFLYVPIIGMTLMFMTHQNYPGVLGSILATEARSSAPMQQPTQNNPFMNVLMTDYAGNPERPPAADVEDPKVKVQMEKHFSNGLYRDIDDVWDHNNSQRQFYTNPATTIPNDRDSFMKWCWNTPYTCKDGNLVNCLKYEDVRRGHI